MIFNSALQKLFRKIGYKIVPYKTSTQVTKEKLFKAYGLQLDAVKYDFCFKSYKQLLDIKDKLNATLSIDIDEKLEIAFQGMRFRIIAADEVYVIYEVFVKGMYNYTCNEDFMLVDIGMNIGTTCLYFSRLQNCKRIIAFEPFDKTIKAAQHNYQLNSTITGKIEINSVGLGYPARKLEVQYTEQQKGSTGIHGVAEYVGNTSQTETATLQIADVYESLKPVIENNALKKIIKIDCEGAEYEILERLNKTNSIQSFDAYMIEWHLKGPKEIVDLLTANGFHVHSTDEFEKHIGMVYAYKKSS